MTWLISHNLFVTHDRSLPSPFLQQLSEDCWL